MFNKNSVIYKVNIINKILCFILVIISLVICKLPLFMLFTNIILLLITFKYKDIFKFNVLSLIISLFSFIYPQNMWISKIIVVFIYLSLLNNATKIVEIRYFLENTLYKFKNKWITYRFLYFIYYIKYFRINFDNMYLLKDDYNIKCDMKFIKLLIKKSFDKTNLQMKDFLQIHMFRFYNYSSKRTYLEKCKWESWDITYFISHIIIFLLTIFYGR